MDIASLRSKRWRESYRTSAVLPDSQPVDILHDFYIPALQRSIRYDRMAGYFRSSSLAAASQGFSALVGRRGKARFIVGADLDPGDVEAILRGDQQRYSVCLNSELGEADAWPDEVTKGVELLSWMVAREYLEVRVAFRIHARTGEALPYGSRMDGYAHEKWAIFRDEADDRLLATGSLNESKTALTLNAENLDVHCDWWDDRARRRVDDAEQSFEALWRDTHPYFRVMPLPEAVRRRLVRIGESVDFPTEIDGTSAAPRRVEPPSARERLQFALLRDGPRLPGGRFVGMATAPVEPWPHQSIVARRLIENYPFSYLLCDEVGLGKTIEAGLAIRSLYLSGLVKRVLIAPPASIKEQWQREMASKFLLPFARTETSPSLEHLTIHPIEDVSTSGSSYSPDLNIVSSAILARRDRRPDVEAAAPFDIVLIDEAHACRRRNPTDGLQAHPDYTFLYQTVRDYLQEKTKSLWLATATPMQLEKIEAWDLLRLTRRAGSFLFDPTLTFEYYGCLGQLVREEELADAEWKFVRFAINSVQEHDPMLWDFLKNAVIDARIRRPVKRWLERGDEPRGRDRKLTHRLIFSSAPLSRVMMRHTRPLLELYREKGQLQQKLASREILPIPKIEFTPQEQRAYDELDTYCDELSRQIRQHADEPARHHLGFYKSFLRLRFASSFHAITETVRRRKEKVKLTLEHLEASARESEELDAKALKSLVMEPEEEDPREVEEAVLKNRSSEDLRWEIGKLDELLGALENLSGPSSKMSELLETLDTRREATTGRIKQMVIFTRFYDTLSEIVRQLRNRDPGMLIGTYSGKGGQYTNPRTNRLLPVDRERVKHLFLRGEIDVLVCTDAAAEGLNLQTANLIVNYDLPWNPMKLEQRIGRLDRIGQKHDHVLVLNLCYLGSAEEKVYGRLLRRLRQAGKIVGTQQLSMLPVQPEEFRQLAEGELDEKELEKEASRRAEAQQERTMSMEIPPEELYDVYRRLEQERAADVLPVDLGAIWIALSQSEYLEALGCKTAKDVDERLFIACGVDGVPDKTYLTTSRELLEQGLPDETVDLHFASYGDRYFDAILEDIGRYDLPECIRRISVSVDNCPAELVGYAVATFGPGGSEQVKLVTAWEDLKDLEIAEDGCVPDQELARLESRLRRMAREEFKLMRAAERIERDNVRAGRAQIAFAYLLARALLQSAARDTERDDFAAVARGLEEELHTDSAMSISGLSAKELRSIRSELLFEPTVPSIGPKATVFASSTMLRSAFDAACRTADAAKGRWSELSVDDVIRRLGSRIDEAMREFHET
jgi:superfamily II DNA or RNA helicase